MSTIKSNPLLAVEASTVVPQPLNRAPRLRKRAIALGVLLLPVNAFWQVDMEFVRYSAHPSGVSLFFNCIFALVVLVALNGLILRVRRSLALTQAELLLVYSMLCIGTCMAGHDFGQVLVGTLAWPYAFSTPAHDYQRVLGNTLPRWAMVHNADALYGFYHGHDTFYTLAHLKAWLPAVAVWTGFVTVLLGVMLCINVVLRKQWTDNERLSYPLVRMPLDLTSRQPLGSGVSASLWTSRLFWTGFSLAAGMDVMNSLNYYYPAIPAIFPSNVSNSLQSYFPYKPWNAIGWTPMTFYPFVVAGAVH